MYINNSLKRKTINISCDNTDLTVQVYKVRINDSICKTNKKRSWLSYYNQFHLAKFEKPNPAINQILSNWFHSFTFSNQLENYRVNKFLKDESLLNTRVIIPKENNKTDKGFANHKKITRLPKSSLEKNRKYNFLRPHVSNPEAYLNVAMSRIYKSFKNQISVENTEDCVELLKIKVCNLVLKNPSVNSWNKVEYSIGSKNYTQNIKIKQRLRKWYESPEFKIYYQKFVSCYPNADSHPKLGFRIVMTAKKKLIKQQIETIKCFIFESLLALSKEQVIENHDHSSFLKTKQYLNFVNQNQFLKVSLNAIDEWYHSKTFSQDFNAFLNNFNHVPQTLSKQQSYDLYQSFEKPETNHVNINWANQIEQDIVLVLRNDLELTQNFNNYYKDLLSQRSLRPLTQFEKEKEKQDFLLVNETQDLKNWLKNSPSLSNQILSWWSDILSSNQKTLLTQFDWHHIMPCYMENYGVPRAKINLTINLIPLTPNMHALIHGIRFLEYENQEDYLAIGRAHHHNIDEQLSESLQANALIKIDRNKTVHMIINNFEWFSKTFRKFQFINYPKIIQQTFAQDMIWQTICDYSIKTITIKGKTVANYSELLCVLNKTFKPHQKLIPPSKNKIDMFRKYLLGKTVSMGGDQWQLLNLNHNMQQAKDKINVEAELRVLRFVLWEYTNNELTHFVVIRQVKKLKNIVEQMEVYQKEKFEPLVSKNLIQLISQNNIGSRVQNWTLVKTSSFLSDF